MKDLRTRINEADSLLAPYAVPIEGKLGRVHPEPPDDTRFPFQRDRDRIIHADAFRRLKGKTQVFVAGTGDHYRTRLTHTMEVAQISRDIARTLSLNEDLAECIALAHDLGHPPFGHTGEQALDAWLKPHGLRFEHNRQSLRVVTLLEEHADGYPGLNLNREVLDGLAKHEKNDLNLEAQAVNISDEIAYTGHDCDDGLRAELFTMEELSSIPLVAQARKRAAKRGSALRGAIIHLLVSDLYAETESRLSSGNLSVGFSKDTDLALKALREFLWQRMYLSPIVTAVSSEGAATVTALCDALLKKPTEKVLALRKKTGGGLPEAVTDYVAGMTDAYARMQLQ